MKRIFRGPWVWIVIAVVGVLLALQYLAPSGGFEEIKTSEMISKIQAGEVEEITFVDGDQEIRAVGTDGETEYIAYWVQGQQGRILDVVDRAAADGDISEYNSENPQPSVLGSILATLLPFALIILLFLFLMNQVQGGGGRVMQFAKSKACLLYTSPSPRDKRQSRMPSSA